MIEIDIDKLSHDDSRLVAMAREATLLSYSPYSGFSVGAAVLLENGEIVKGANQENASYPVGICAERSTIATAQNIHPNIPVKALALAAKSRNTDFSDDFVTPCGMCRQALNECEKRYQRNIRIIMTSGSKAVIAESVKELLPMAFT